LRVNNLLKVYQLARELQTIDPNKDGTEFNRISDALDNAIEEVDNEIGRQKNPYSHLCFLKVVDTPYENGSKCGVCHKDQKQLVILCEPEIPSKWRAVCFKCERILYRNCQIMFPRGLITAISHHFNP